MKDLVEKRICPAMREAGIDDPESEKGIDFCVRKCPYQDGCIVMEVNPRTTLKNKRREEARDLDSDGLTVKEIAVTLRLSPKTIQGYLKRTIHKGS